ncbi:hypothetical protein [Microbacterium sp.]|uniref:hypothetical protein n=1 Tax=Microbacterium sp. TaxID=51671 RepID=UPI002FE41B0B
MNAQLKIAGQSSDLERANAHPDALRAGPEADSVESAPAMSHPSSVAFDDESRIEDWVEEGGASR